MSVSLRYLSLTLWGIVGSLVCFGIVHAPPATESVPAGPQALAHLGGPPALTQLTQAWMADVHQHTPPRSYRTETPDPIDPHALTRYFCQRLGSPCGPVSYTDTLQAHAFLTTYEPATLEDSLHTVLDTRLLSLEDRQLFLSVLHTLLISRPD